jgi:Tfp pilus assembly protein PilF
MEALKLQPPATETPAAEIQEAAHHEPVATAPTAESQETAEPPSSPTNINSAMNEILQEMTTAESTVEAEDFEAHYQKGLEYRNKGEIEEAIAEIAISTRDETNVLRNMRMLALCYMDKGDFAAAVASFQKILSSLSPENSGYVHLMYALAEAHKQNGDNDAATEAYKAIYAQDPAFRDVAEKLQLQVPHREPQAAQPRRTSPKPAFDPEQKKNRIAYI